MTIFANKKLDAKENLRRFQKLKKWSMIEYFSLKSNDANFNIVVIVNSALKETISQRFHKKKKTLVNFVIKAVSASFVASKNSVA